MATRKYSTGFTMVLVILFGVAGWLVGFFSVYAGLLEKIFYTTKPSAFLDSWQVWLFNALFAASFACIPFAADRSHRSAVDSGAPRQARFLSFLAAWVGAAFVTGLLVSVIAATIHHKMQHVPDWLIPLSLLLVPIGPGITVLVVSFWRAGSSADSIRQ